MCDSGNISKFSGIGREENDSKRTAGEQRVNISRDRVGAGYNLAGLKKQSRADLYFVGSIVLA